MKKRLNTWKQDTPREQLAALVAGVTAHACNLVDRSILNPIIIDGYHQYIYKTSQEALDILRYWPNLDSWD